MDYEILKTLLILTPITFILCTLGLYLIMLPKPILAKIANKDFVLGRFIKAKPEDTIKKYYRAIGIFLLIASIATPTAVYIIKFF